MATIVIIALGVVVAMANTPLYPNPKNSKPEDDAKKDYLRKTLLTLIKK